MKKINITFCSYPDYSGNAKALYLYMKNKYRDLYNYTWVFVNEDLFNKYKDETNGVMYRSEKYEKYISKTDIFFTTHVNLVDEKVKAKNSYYVELGHGIGMKPGGYLTLNPSNEELKWTESVSGIIDYTVCPSHFYSMLSASALNINVGRCLPLGFPKLDFLLSKKSKEKLSSIVGTDINRFKKIIFYLPTFRKGVYRNEKIFNSNNILDLMKYDESDLIKYLEDNNYVLCVKRHPSDASNKKYNSVSNNIIEIDNKILQESGYDINEIVSAADLLITDYSSVGIEFMFLEKPVIFLSTDEKSYIKNRGIIFQDFDFWSCNSNIDTLDNLLSTVNLYFKDYKKYGLLFIKRKKLYFGDLKDGGCKNIYNYFFKDGKLSDRLTHPNNLANTRNYYDSIINKKDLEINSLNNYISELYESKIRLDEIENSKIWKLSEKFRKIFKRK